MTDDILKTTWRVGRKLLRTIYAETGGNDRDADELLGMVDSPAVARRIVALHNASLARAEQLRDADANIAEPP